MPEPPPAANADLPQRVRIMAHDLKNPLAALMTNLHYVRTSLGASIDVEVEEAIADSVALCEVLERFIANLDLLTRTTHEPTRRAPVSLTDVATEIVSKA